MVVASRAVFVLAILFQGAAEEECKCGRSERATQVPSSQDHAQGRKLSQWRDAATGSSYEAPQGGKYKRRLASADLKLGEVPRHPECPSQVHIAVAGPGRMAVSWAVWSFDAPAGKVKYGPSHSNHLKHEAQSDGGHVYSHVMSVRNDVYSPRFGNVTFPTDDIAEFVGNLTKLAQGVRSGKKHSDGDPYFAANIYDSPVLHTAVLVDLKDGHAYKYMLPGDCEARVFRMPPKHFPLTFGLTGDVGQTEVSKKSLQELEKLNPAAVLLAGDLSYSDGFGPRWDRFGELAEPLGQRFPIMTCVGNHEVAHGEQFVGYNARWPMPFRASDSKSNTFWSADIGPVHVISLNTYTRHSKQNHQYRWLLQELPKVDRAKTPWLVVMMHGPFYCTNHEHSIANEPATGEMKALMEPLFIKYGVDFVINGHVHAYERTFPVSQGKKDPCGPVYLSLGDGGNYEGASKKWQAATEWSAFRESTFGIGRVDFHNETHAFFEWGKLACQSDTDAIFSPTCSTTGVEEVVSAFGPVHSGTATSSDKVALKSWKARCPHAHARKHGHDQHKHRRGNQKTTRLFEQEKGLESALQQPGLSDATVAADSSRLWINRGSESVRSGVNRWLLLNVAGMVALSMMGSYVVVLRRRLSSLELRGEADVELSDYNLYPDGAE